MLMDRVIQPTMARIDKDKVDKYNKAYDDIIELRDQTSVIDNGSATHIQLKRIKAKKAFDESIKVVTDIITKTKVNRSRIKDINCQINVVYYYENDTDSTGTPMVSPDDEEKVR
jgi:hypothetical protein